MEVPSKEENMHTEEATPRDIEIAESENGIAEHDPVVLLVSTVKANKALIKQARAEIQQSRESIRDRSVWKDFVRKFFTFS